MAARSHVWLAGSTRSPAIATARRPSRSPTSKPGLPFTLRTHVPSQPPPAVSFSTRKLMTTSLPSRAEMETPESYTTAFALFEAMWEAGITACFVNVGSDHPSILEAIVRGKRERPGAWPRMITCPSEITAISMADGYARVTGRPQAVLVHVDVGTQALGQGIHNASVGRAPVFIFAGMCPYTEAGELPGSRTEYMHWLQEAPDQKAIVRQYCRYTGEVRTGLNVKQTVGRALQFANSTPKGPVYVASAREVLAQEMQPYSLDQEQWVPIGPSALTADAVRDISTALVQAERPLIITGYSGRDRRNPGLLVALADLIPGIRVHDTGGSDMCFPFSHVASEGFRLSRDECTRDADVFFLLDCDVPWIPSHNPPRKDAKIYHVDSDPLNQQMPVSFFPAHGRWKADSFTALTQLIDYIENDALLTKTLQDPRYTARGEARANVHKARLETLALQPRLSAHEALDAHNIGSLLRTSLPDSTTFVVGVATATQMLSDQIQASRPGSWINCGGTGIGWSNGAAMGVQMALEDAEKDKKSKTECEPSLVCHIVGDGSFMCAAPASALWVASKYGIPVLTIVLNNGGWKAPRNSTQIMYPTGLNTTASDDELNISFRPSPNYAALAEAAAGSEVGWGNATEDPEAWMKGLRVRTVGDFKEALQQAGSRVAGKGKGMLIEAQIDLLVGSVATVASAVTVSELWRNLVVEADNEVLYRKRKQEPRRREYWRLAFVGKDKTGSVAEVSRWIAGPLSDNLCLTRAQTIVKQEIMTDDIALFLDTLWTRAADIRLTPAKRIAFHTYLLVTGLAGFQNGSVLSLPYEQVQFGLARDPHDPAALKLVAHILVIQNNRKKDTIQRDQDDKVAFSIGFVPAHTFCLLSLLVARALADDAFEEGYRTLDELLDRPLLEPGMCYLNLPLKQDIGKKPAIPLTQEKLNEIRIVSVSSLECDSIQSLT
ncbi:Uu.00g142040.m01.CDS01 [Anthostomella pinea]|uniref:Uu.00g142040.m01.CDS01 n=1 Tax=Anthostomella pinea TaxID=933095 RepID=A0AAI8VRB0_9PEZI|nr:Uu.00g142040.m01.CDS01 [Anthostomella pinea]